MGLIYLDNAATSWPKPRCTVQAMARALEESGANPGRAGHRLSLEAGRIVERCRQALADMLGETDASRIAFAQNATDALNMAIHGAVRTGDHVVSTLIEHNSVLRPLSELARSGVITLTLVPPDADGRMDAREIERALTARTRLVAMTHTSNVLGLEQDVAAVGAVCRRRGVLFLVDAAQTAGHLPLEPKKWGCTMLAMPGHKGLLGPQGTGILLCFAQPEPLLYGGTGSQSMLQTMPEQLPDRLEAGTHNVPGIAGLLAGIRYVSAQGVDNIARRERRLSQNLSERLRRETRLEVFASPDASCQTAVLSVRCRDMDCETLAQALAHSGIAVRAGLHCAPVAHRTAGTLETGTVRLSLSPFTTDADIAHTARAFHDILRTGKSGFLY